MAARDCTARDGLALDLSLGFRCELHGAVPAQLREGAGELLTVVRMVFYRDQVTDEPLEVSQDELSALWSCLGTVRDLLGAADQLEGR